MGATGLEWVALGFFSRQDEDLIDVCPHWSGRSVEFRKAPPGTPLGASCLEITGSDGIWSCTPIFFSYSLILEGALWSSVVCCHHRIRLLQSMVKSETENNMEAKFQGQAMVVRVFVTMRNLLGDSWIVVAASASGGKSTGEVQSPTLQDENPRSDLNWLCLTMTLLKILFCERGLSPKWKPITYDLNWWQQRLCTISFFGGITIGENELLVLSWWCLYCFYK
jgi:hypothetical protein